MKKSFPKGIHKNAFLVVAFIAFVVLTGNKKIEHQHVADNSCCTGYNIGIGKLKKFMLDSLHGIQFEGGVYSKANLITAINKIAGDSVYLMNALKNCNTSEGTDLALTSPQTPGVVFVRRPGCTPCPGKVCCGQRVCAARINRGCIDYQVSQAFSGSDEESIALGE